ncbi:hypothetical protein ZIOFF_043689 [Zingiber officinale]|uniref:Fucosyltransferase n=2 Tax=Zingiber officinale TaxID=94328 RepID=A0A8J5FTT3_ZINOF|nr:hypothetical protein ZIOFF_043689 [Zingiber officinale]
MERHSSWVRKTTGAMTITCLMLLPLLLLVTQSAFNTYLDRLLPHVIRERIGKKFTSITVKEISGTSFCCHQSYSFAGWKDGSLTPRDDDDDDKLLGGLLSGDFDESSCLSRYHAVSYWKNPSRPPSPHLAAKLRRYEALHKRCGPGTELFEKAIHHLNSSNHTAGKPTTDCNYVVWVPSDGLGNRIIALVSTFLYALLNDKILLLHLTDDFHDLLCEPFPGTSWSLPQDFPVGDLLNIYADPPWTLSNPQNAPYLYLHLTHDQRFSAHGFFCEDSQLLLRSFQWLLLRSNQYFVPALFRSSVYEKELKLMFSDADVFYHLGRYLLHPTNSVWGYITRYYHAYLADAEQIIGLQIRVFPSAPISSDQMLAQLLNCSWQEGLLPEVMIEEAMNSSRWKGNKPKAVLLTTLYSGYYERLKSMYNEHPTVDGEVIAVHQPSHEEKQHTEERNHNKKALMEMYLLSFCDVLVTSGYSTFGYVPQGLSGLRAWILVRPDGGGESVSCRRAVSTEPCFHAPMGYQCIGEKKRKDGEEEAMRCVGKCEDVAGGLKLVS